MGKQRLHAHASLLRGCALRAPGRAEPALPEPHAAPGRGDPGRMAHLDPGHLANRPVVHAVLRWLRSFQYQHHRRSAGSHCRGISISRESKHQLLLAVPVLTLRVLRFRGKLLFLILGSFPWPALSASRVPSVVLISVDTLRADHLGCYGYRKIRTPNLDALAQGGTLFSRVDSP